MLTITRRSVLRGLGVAPALLPFLPRGMAAAAPAPKRFICVFSPNGRPPGTFFPAAGGFDLATSECLKMFVPFKNQTVLFRGLTNAAARTGPSDTHGRGMVSWLTGYQSLSNAWAGGASIDQVIATHIQTGSGQTPRKSLELGVVTETANERGRMIFDGPSQPRSPIEDPREAVRTILGGGAPGGGPAGPSPQQLSALDFLANQQNGEFTRVLRKVAAADRARIDQHLTALRELEHALKATPTGASACVAPALEPSGTGRQDLVISKNHVKTMVAALACGITRVGSIQWQRATGARDLAFLGLPENFHTLSHQESNPASVVKLVKANAWFAGEIAELMRQLQERSENNGTMLDNTLILWGSEIATGSHSFDNLPFVLFGGAGGALRGGRILETPAIHHNRLLVSICNLMGLPQQTFGDGRFQQGPLPGLV